MKTVLKCVIKTVSPVHIGCDEVYEPTAFSVDERNLELNVFSPFDFLYQLPENEVARLTEICREGSVSSLLKIYKFMRGVKLNGRKVRLCPGFIEHYNQTLGMAARDERKVSQELNRFAIERTAFLANDEKPYIPGSSVKGSLRTAYLNFLVGQRNVPRQSGRDAAKKLERALLGGKFATDPFRCIKVSDFKPVGKVTTRIVYAVNEKKDDPGKRARGPYQILEIVEPGSLFEGTITVEHPERGANIKNPITRKALFDALRYFYGNEKVREDRELENIGIKAPEIETGNGLYLLRIGRHSGAESVTIEGHRSIKILGQRQNASRATTLWLASDTRKPVEKAGLKPFGWVMLTDNLSILSDDMEKVLRSSGTAHKKAQYGRQMEKICAREIVWDNAYLTWTPQNQTLTATSAEKATKATVTGKEKVEKMVPEAFYKKLFKKRKSVSAKVTVSQLGNRYEILKIEDKG